MTQTWELPLYEIRRLALLSDIRFDQPAEKRI